MTEDVNSVRKNFQPIGHSNFFAILEDDSTQIVRRTMCLRGLTYGRVPKKAVFIFMEAKKKTNPYKKWVDWVINRSFMAEAFITKDVDEGMSMGFEMNTCAPRLLFNAGMIAIRHPFEFIRWDWELFLDMGFNEVESFALANTFYLNKNNLFSIHRENSNHKIVPPWSSPECYEGKRIRWSPVNKEVPVEGFSAHTIPVSGSLNSSPVRYGEINISIEFKEMAEGPYGDSFECIQNSEEALRSILEIMEKN